MPLDPLFESKPFKVAVFSLGGFVVLVFIFGLGVSVGEKKAEFSFRWAEQYHKNFAGPEAGFFMDMRGDQFIQSSGCFGQILKISGQTITVKGGDNVEKNILVTGATTILQQRKNINLQDLKIGDDIIVIGEPDESGQINAGLIRVMPAQDMPRIENL